jgi:hypothetical protein
MAKNYDVYKDGDKWVGKREDASRPSVKADTQAAARQGTREVMGRNGGGELKVHGVNGQIRAKDTIKPANDPRKTKG